MLRQEQEKKIEGKFVQQSLIMIVIFCNLILFWNAISNLVPRLFCVFREREEPRNEVAQYVRTSL